MIKYDRKNIDTDLIIAARYLIKTDPGHLAKYCMEDLDPEFTHKVAKKEYQILVADSNFGSGSSREQAPLAIKASGIKCVIAPSFARIFFRNAINIGLPILEFKEIEAINTDDIVDINFEKGELVNLTTQKRFKIKKMPDFLQEIISQEGLLNYARKKILKAK